MAKTRSEKRRAREARKQFTKRAQEAQWAGQYAVASEPVEDPRIVVLDARARHRGTAPVRAEVESAITARLRAPLCRQDIDRKVDADMQERARAARKAVADDMWGDLAGRAIVIGADTLSDTPKAERQAMADDLWGLFKRLDAVDEAYFRRIIGRPRFPNVAKLEMLPEVFETREDQHPTRYMSEDEKDRAAVSDWMRWQGFLGQLPRDAHSAIVSALRQRVMLSHAGRLTGAGEAFFDAMRLLAVVEKGERKSRGVY